MKVYDGFDMSYDNYDLSPYLHVEQVRRPFVGPIENDFLRVGRFGERFVRSRPGMKTIEVDVRIIGEDRKDVGRIRDFIAGKLIKDEPKKLKLRDSDRFEFAILDGETDFERLRNTGFTTLVFKNPSGLSYLSLNKPRIQGTESKVNNAGTAKVQPIIKFSSIGTKTLFRVENRTTGEYVEITYPAAVGGNFVIGDYDDQNRYLEYVTRNGQSAMTNVSVGSDFFYLEPGLNELVLTGAPSADLEFWESYQ